MNKNNLLSNLFSISTIIFLTSILIVEIYLLSLAIPKNLSYIIPNLHKEKINIIIKEVKPLAIRQTKPARKIIVITKVIKKTILVKKTMVVIKKRVITVKKVHKRFMAKKKTRTHRKIVSTPIIKNTIQSELAFKTAYLEKEKDYPVKTAQNAVVSQLDTKPIRLEKPRFTGLPPTPTFIAPPTIAIIPQKPIEKWMPKDPAYRKSAFYNRELRRN